MIKNMECPYCQHEMIAGYIYGERGDLNWCSEETEPSALSKVFGFGGEIISRRGIMIPKINCYRCNQCNKIIINLDKNK